MQGHSAYIETFARDSFGLGGGEHSHFAAPGADSVCPLQKHVTNTITPYKDPPSVKFIDGLSKTPTGTVQVCRFG